MKRTTHPDPVETCNDQLEIASAVCTSSLDELIREGAQQMLARALELEVADYLRRPGMGMREMRTAIASSCAMEVASHARFK